MQSLINQANYMHFHVKIVLDMLDFWRIKNLTLNYFYISIAYISIAFLISETRSQPL
jgi:hypothetical protein